MEMGTRDTATSTAQAWSSQSENMRTTADAEIGAELDEPPDLFRRSVPSRDFQKTSVRKPNAQSSLLTRALQHPSDDEDETDAYHSMPARLRRRSMTSNISLASTADLTSDTGLTSPSRANTPSPPLPEITTHHLHDFTPGKRSIQLVAPPKSEAKPEAKPEAGARKRCISFACAAKPDAKLAEPTPLRPTPMVKAPSAQEAPRRSCIKFACPAPRPASTQNTPPRQSALSTEVSLKATPTQKDVPASPARKLRAGRPQLLRRSSKENRSTKTVNVDPAELEEDSAQFHEFASEQVREDDWIRHERQRPTTTKQKLTINDTLTKENRFRQIAKEAEEEAEAEEDDEAGPQDEDDEEDDVESEDNEEDDEDEDEDDEDEDDSEYGTDEGDDGYHTDEETGFAESDDEEDDDLELWTPSQNPTLLPAAPAPAPASRRSSLSGHHSDSSATSRRSLRAVREGKARRVPIRPLTPELPDSTDFVCGTLDEDRPMEEAYLSCIAARKAQKLHVIPQDIDPSFPASDPEDEEAEERFNPVHHDSDEDVWLHGEMDDLHHEQERHGRKKNKAGHSPKRFHSPPPKRQKSPVRIRGRSPRPGQTSPRRLRSPAPKALTSSRASPVHTGPVVGFGGLGAHVGLTQTKSLPRPPAMFPHAKSGKKTKVSLAPRHIRGAIDIVKGLESKRQRRKEKFYYKYCNRARKGQIPERKPMPGQGAERMKELGLLMAGKSTTRGNYVLSV